MSSEISERLLKQKRIDGFNSIVGSIFHSCTIGLVLSMRNFYPHLLSYLQKENNPHSDYLFSCTFLLAPVFTMFGGFLVSKISISRTIIIGEVAIVIVYYLLNLFDNLYAIYCFVILIGVGFGMTIMLARKNACMYFPKNRGGVFAIISSFIIGSSEVFDYIAEKIIVNFTKEKKVTEEVKNYFLFQIIASGTLTLISIYFLVPYEESSYKILDGNNDVEGNNAKKAVSNFQTNSFPQPETFSVNVSEGANEETPINDQEVLPEDSDFNEESVNEYSIIMVKGAIKSFRVWRLILINFFTHLITNVILDSSRKVGKKDQKLNTWGFFVSLVSTFIWGCSVDYLPFKLILVVNEFLNFGIGILYKFFTNNTITFFIVQITKAGIDSIIVPHIMNVFGKTQILEIIGLCTILNGVSGLLSAFFTLKIESPKSEKTEKIYMIVYYVCSGLAVIPLILAFFENDTPFIIDE